MALPLFGYPTRLLDIHFGHKGLAVWNVGVNTFDVVPDGSGVVRTKSSTGLPPPSLSNDQIAALIKRYPVNTTVLVQETPATVTFQFQDLALPPVSSATATAEVEANPPAAQPQFTDATNKYLNSLVVKSSGTTGLTFQFLGPGNGPNGDAYTEPTESFTIPTWVTIVGKKFA